MRLAKYGSGRSSSSSAARKDLGHHFGAAFAKNRLFIMRIIDEVFGQLVQLPVDGLPLQRIVLITHATGQIDGDEATAGCQVASHFGIDFPFDIKDDLAAIPIDNLAKFCAGFAVAGGAEFDYIAKLRANFCWLYPIHLTVLPFSDQEVVPVKRGDFNGVEFMFIC